MDRDTPLSPPSVSLVRPWREPVWILRGTLLLQASGVAASLLFATLEHESDIFGLLYFDWNWPEAAAQRFEDYGTRGFLAAAVLLAVVPAFCAFFRRSLDGPAWTRGQVPLLLYVALWQFLMAATYSYRGGTFLPQWIVPEQAVRYAAPLAILLLLPERQSGAPSPARWRRSLQVLRWSAALTFAAHGVKAIYLSPQFVTLLVGTFPALPESMANQALLTIGMIDLVAAGLLVTTRWRLVAAWMVFWGLLTSLSRITALGLDVYPEVLLRTGNWSVPLALVWMRNDPAPRDTPPSN
jgi:hypothetical protein